MRAFLFESFPQNNYRFNELLEKDFCGMKRGGGWNKSLEIEKEMQGVHED